MFSATMNYRFTWAVQGFFVDDALTTSQFEDRLATLRKDTPPPALLSQMNLISSHDLRRALTACHEDKQRFMQMVAFQMSYPGAPMIYYGDEAGLTGETGEAGRQPFPWGKEDQTILSFYRKVLSIRQQYPALKYGSFEVLKVDDDSRVYAFSRCLDSELIYAYFNASSSVSNILLPMQKNADMVWINLLDNDFYQTAAAVASGIELHPYSVAWYQCKKN